MFGILYEMSISMSLSEGLQPIHSRVHGKDGKEVDKVESVILGYDMSFFALFWLFLRCFGGLMCFFFVLYFYVWNII